MKVPLETNLRNPGVEIRAGNARMGISDPFAWGGAARTRHAALLNLRRFCEAVLKKVDKELAKEKRLREQGERT